MVSVTKLRNGATFEYRGEPWRVVDYKHVHLSRGSGAITLRARNLRNGSLLTLPFRSGDRLEEISVVRRKTIYLYRDGEDLLFMDPVTFQEHRLSASVVGEGAGYLTDGQESWVFFWEDEPLDVEIPPKMAFLVRHSSPGVRGDTVAGATKDVILENGLHLRTPLFIKEGDRVVVDTRTGEYVEREGRGKGKS